MSEDDATRSAAAAVLVDPQRQFALNNLCQRITVTVEPSGLRGGDAESLAGRVGAPKHEVVAAIAMLTGRDVHVVATEAAPAPARKRTVKQQRRARKLALERLREREPFKPTGERDLDQLVASFAGKYPARAAARMLQQRLGGRDPAGLHEWEIVELEAEVGWADYARAGLELLTAIHSRPHIRAAWQRWQATHEPPSRRASAPPGPPDRRRRAHGERELGELKRRIANAKEIPVPRMEALRWPVIRDRRAQRDPDTGMYEVVDMLGTVTSSWKPSVRYLRWMLGAALLLREADHEANPGGDGRRTVFTSYNALAFAATGRDCHAEEYEALDGWINDMVTGHLRATDNQADRRRAQGKSPRELAGTPLEDAFVRVDGDDGAEWCSFAAWYQLDVEQRPRRARGSGPTLMLVFAESFYAAVMNRGRHTLVSKPTAWTTRDELATLVALEAHTGIRRDGSSPTASWETFAAPPLLATVGLRGGENQRAGELLLEDDLYAIEEAWEPVTAVIMGDAKNGFGWVHVSLDRRGGHGRRPQLRARRTRTRAERRSQWHAERPQRVGRKRTFSRPGTPGRGRRRREDRARQIVEAAQASSGQTRTPPRPRPPWRRGGARHVGSRDDGDGDAAAASAAA